MKIAIVDLKRYHVECFNAQGSSQSYGATADKNELEEQILKSREAGYNIAVIYTVSEIRTTEV